MENPLVTIIRISMFELIIVQLKNEIIRLSND